MQIAHEDVHSSIDHLNSFLRGELAAVETYNQVLEKLRASPHRETLEMCLLSHQQRATRLRGEIRRLGGEPDQGSGMWGAFAKLIEGGAKLAGDWAAIAALEEGEDHGRNDYTRDLDQLERGVRQLVEMELLPEQQRTHQAMSSLKHTLH